MTKPRLDCYDAIVPPQTKPERVTATVVNDCRFLKDDDERPICFNRFVENLARPVAPKGRCDASRSEAHVDDES